MEQHARPEEGSENAARRVRELVHELNALLDGSMRCLSLAQRALREGDGDADLARRLDVVRGALDRMADLVRDAMSPGTLLLRHPISLEEAIRHACEVNADRAAELGVRIEAALTGSFERIPAGRLYVAILNGVRNAVDSIERRGGPGTVSVEGSVEGSGEGEMVEVRIRDDGEGLAGAGRGGMGIGLGVSRAIAVELGGTLELRERCDGGRGALLSLRVPAQELARVGGEREIG